MALGALAKPWQAGITVGVVFKPMLCASERESVKELEKKM